MSRQLYYILCATVLILLAGAANAMRLHVGVAETSITPNQKVALEGQFRLRVSQGVETPVTANVLVLESRDGEKVLERSVIVSADLCYIPTSLWNMVREKAAKRIPGLDTKKILISATHTHTAPVVDEGNFIIPKGVMKVGDYRTFFADRVSDAIVKAHGSLKPASVAWGIGFARVAYNRRAMYYDGKARMYGPTSLHNYKGPEGPAYNGIPALYFFNDSGKPIGVAVNVWCPSQEVESRSKINADFWHPARRRLKKHFGSELVVVGWCGPAGDISPHRRELQRAEDRMMRMRGITSWTDELGRRIATSVIDTYEVVKNAKHKDTLLAHHVETVRLPGWKLGEKELARMRRDHAAHALDLKRHPDKADKLARPATWRGKAVELHEQVMAGKDGCYPTEIHVLRVGDTAICTSQFELFTEFGLRILGRSKAHLTFVVQLAGPALYLPTEQALRAGGYGTAPESCAVGPAGGRALVERTLERIEALWK